MIEWISVKESLPNHGERVLIYNGGVDVAKFKRGISEEEREKMRNGELPDYEEEGWCLSAGYTMHKRSSVITAYDEGGNNLVPYGWDVGATVLFGQNVSHWAYFNTPEQYKTQRIKDLEQELNDLYRKMEADKFFKEKLLPNLGVGYIRKKEEQQ